MKVVRQCRARWQRTLACAQNCTPIRNATPNKPKLLLSSVLKLGIVVGGPLITGVNPIGRLLPPRDLVLYELMVDDFTAEYRGDRAPVDAIWDRLDYLQNLGVNGIELMPWTAWWPQEYVVHARGPHRPSV